MSPGNMGTGDNLSPTRKSIKVSGRAMGLVEDLEGRLSARYGRTPTHNEIILWLFENQKDSRETLHKELLDIEKFIKQTFPVEVATTSSLLIALIKQIANGHKDPIYLEEILQEVIVHGNGQEAPK